jgi:hypothetical protein
MANAERAGAERAAGSDVAAERTRRAAQLRTDGASVDHTTGAAQPPSLRGIVAPLIAIVLGTFMAILDVTVVNVAPPTFGRIFQADLNLLQGDYGLHAGAGCGDPSQAG